MPLYEFQCPKCKGIREEVLHMNEVPDAGTECPQYPCTACGTVTVRIFSATHVAVLKTQEVYHKNPRRHMEKIQEVMNEPLTTAEIKEGTALLKEREKQLEKPEGTLTTGRPAPKSKKEFEEKIVPVAKKRAADSRAMRGRSWK